MIVSVLYRYRFLYLFVLLITIPLTFHIMYPSLAEIVFRMTSNPPAEDVLLSHTGLKVGLGEDCPTYGVGFKPDFTQPPTFIFTSDHRKVCGCMLPKYEPNLTVLSRLNQDGSVSFLCDSEVITLRF